MLIETVVVVSISLVPNSEFSTVCRNIFMFPGVLHCHNLFFGTQNPWQLPWLESVNCGYACVFEKVFFFVVHKNPRCTVYVHGKTL